LKGREGRREVQIGPVRMEEAKREREEKRREEKKKKKKKKKEKEKRKEEEVETYGCGREELRQRLAGFDALSLDVSSSVSERLPARIRKGDEPLEE
jgi:hypothetical protein